MQGVETAWDSFKRELEKSNDESVNKVRLKTVRQFNETLRHFRQYKTEGEWISALLNSAAAFVDNVAIFTVADGRFLLQAERNVSLLEGLNFPLSSAPALASASDSKDVIVALSTTSEVGPQLAVAGKERRAVLVPVVNGARTVALIVSFGPADAASEALELISGIASLVLERASNRDTAIQIAPLAPAAAKPAPNSLSAWSHLPEQSRNLHLRAQRFARVTVAEMQLAKPDAASAGREQNDVYLFLKKEIEAARETYRSQFMRSRDMVDYLHLELVHILADGDELKMGAEYPGPLL